MMTRERQQRLPVRRQRPVVQPPGAGHGHRELHDLGGLEADEAEVQPALRALADVAGDVDHDEQHDAEIHSGSDEPAQEGGFHLRQRAHGDAAERGADGAVDDAVPVLARGAVQHDEAVERDQPEAHEQRTVELQRAENAAGGGEGAAAARADFDGFVHHSSPGAAGATTAAPVGATTGGGISGVVVLAQQVLVEHAARDRRGGGAVFAVLDDHGHGELRAHPRARTR